MHFIYTAGKNKSTLDPFVEEKEEEQSQYVILAIIIVVAIAAAIYYMKGYKSKH